MTPPAATAVTSTTCVARMPAVTCVKLDGFAAHLQLPEILTVIPTMTLYRILTACTVAPNASNLSTCLLQMGRVNQLTCAVSTPVIGACLSALISNFSLNLL